MLCTKEFLDSVDPKKSGNKFSTNIRKYLAKYKGYELPNVYRVASSLNDIFGSYSFIVGDYDIETKWLHGKRLTKVMSNHRAHGYAYTPNCFKYVECEADFWKTYQKIGRCAIDIHHQMDMKDDDDRFNIIGDIKKCTWCNNFEFVKEIITHTYEVWTKKETENENTI